MTNSTELGKCLHKLEALRRLTPNEEITTQIALLETQERLLKKFPSRNWQTILKGLESSKLKDYLY